VSAYPITFILETGLVPVVHETEMFLKIDKLNIIHKLKSTFAHFSCHCVASRVPSSFSNLEQLNELKLK